MNLGINYLKNNNLSLNNIYNENNVVYIINKGNIKTNKKCSLIIWKIRHNKDTPNARDRRLESDWSRWVLSKQVSRPSAMLRTHYRKHTIPQHGHIGGRWRHRDLRLAHTLHDYATTPFNSQWCKCVHMKRLYGIQCWITRYLSTY